MRIKSRVGTSRVHQEYIRSTSGVHIIALTWSREGVVPPRARPVLSTITEVGRALLSCPGALEGLLEVRHDLTQRALQVGGQLVVRLGAHRWEEVCWRLQ